MTTDWIIFVVAAPIFALVAWGIYIIKKEGDRKKAGDDERFLG